MLINAGGPATAPYVADVNFTGGTAINHANAIDVSGVTNPAPAAVYQTARTGTFSYTIGGFAAGSSHTVRLHMCETYFNTTGSRTFNVSLNGNQVLSNFDIFAQAGGKNRAITETVTGVADATGGLTLGFTTLRDNAKVSGIEVFSTTGIAPGYNIHAGGSASHPLLGLGSCCHGHHRRAPADPL